MLIQIQCECGYVARGDLDDTVVGMIQKHMSVDHPDLARTVVAEDIRGWIEVVG